MSEEIKSFRFEDVTLSFDDLEVLKDCSFEFPLNRNCRIVFKNDREKFHFFYGLSQVEGFKKGKFLINDDAVNTFSFEEFQAYRLKIGYGFSTRGLIHNRTLRQNLELPLRYHNLYQGAELQDWFEHCVEYFALGSDLDRRPAEVSACSQKATLILRAFVLQPEMVILDTPEQLLSSRLYANLLQLIDDHRKDHNLKHLYFATYDEDLSDCLADENIILNKKNLQQIRLSKLKKVGT